MGLNVCFFYTGSTEFVFLCALLLLLQYFALCLKTHICCISLVMFVHADKHMNWCCLLQLFHPLVHELTQMGTEILNTTETQLLLRQAEHETSRLLFAHSTARLITHLPSLGLFAYIFTMTCIYL